jgi:hypothetical protein
MWVQLSRAGTRIAPPWPAMSAERHEFDSGGVLSRARPVLSFSTCSSWGEAAPAPSAPIDATPAPVSWNDAQAPRRSNLPVIPRIVRRTRIERGAVLGPVVRAVSWVGRVGLGTLLFAGLGLATLGTIAGLGMRSSLDEAPLQVRGESRVFDATATERLLARAPLAPRADRAPVLARADPPVSHAPVPQPVAHAAVVSVRSSPAPSRAFAAAHAAKKRPSTAVLARR